MKYLARFFGIRQVGYDFDYENKIETEVVSYLLRGNLYIWSIKQTRHDHD